MMKNKQGKNGEKKLWKRISIAIINGIIGTFIAFMASVVNYSIRVSLSEAIFVVGPVIFMVNFAAVLIWERNENMNTKSKEMIFLSPVIKGVIVGAITGAVETAAIMKRSYVSDGWYIGLFPGGFIGLIIGVGIAVIQGLVHN